MPESTDSRTELIHKVTKQVIIESSNKKKREEPYSEFYNLLFPVFNENYETWEEKYDPCTGKITIETVLDAAQRCWIYCYQN